MTNEISFSISYKKFREPEKIEIPTGFHVVYGESGVAKTHFVKSIAGFAIQNPSNFGSSVIFSILFHLVEYTILAFLVTLAFHRANRFSNLFFFVRIRGRKDEIHMICYVQN